MNTTSNRIAAAFSAGAMAYDEAARPQQAIARCLARRIITAQLGRRPERVLEIGCGTGFLSTELVKAFPASYFIFSDIAPGMLARCSGTLGPTYEYRLMNGEWPDASLGSFDLIVSSLAMQWFADLRSGLTRLVRQLAPGGRLMFATMGQESFAAWRHAHEALGIPCGLHDYPAPNAFPWPDGTRGTLEIEWLEEHFPDGHSFLHALKQIGAGTPAFGYKPLSAVQLRRVLARFAGGFMARYQILYGVLCGE